jgi:hypothetical protein
VQQTALVTLYGKALDSRRPDSILSDREADNALRWIDDDFSTLRMGPRDEKSTAVRAKAYDGWSKRFLDVQPECVVLHLGCGLDTWVYRVNSPSTVEWYDIDLPDVIQLQRLLFPQRAGGFRRLDPGRSVVPAALWAGESFWRPTGLEYRRSARTGESGPGLAFDCEWWFGDKAEIKPHYSWLYWQLMRLLSRITPIRRLGRGLRYHLRT